MKNRTILLVLIILLISTVSIAQPGSLDLDFDADGKVLTDINAGIDLGLSVAVQPDGKIIVAGYTSQTGSPAPRDFAVVRYKTDGSLDNSFGNNGIVITDFGDNSFASSVSIQADGKIVVAGTATESDTNDDIALVRYNTDGTLDESFSADGRLTTDFGSNHDEANSVGIQSDGKIVVAGHTHNGTDSDFCLARYNENGTLDTSFDTNGFTTTDFEGGNDYAFSLAIQTDGKIVVAGNSSNPILGTQRDIAVVRYLSNGSLDNSFGTNGIAITVLGIDHDFAFSVEIQSDGKIVVAGYTENDSKDDIAVLRYQADGTLDSSFGSDGKVITTIGNFADTRARHVMLQADGKIVVSGRGSDQFAIVRYLMDGTFDNSFGTDGIVLTDMGNGVSQAYSAAIQPDGRIVVAGYAQAGSVIAVARYISGLSFGVVDFSIQENSLLVYPNPLQEVAVLEYTLTEEENINIDLYNISGSLVQSFVRSEKRIKGTHKETLDLDASIPSGSYILTLSNGVGSSSVQVVK